MEHYVIPWIVTTIILALIFIVMLCLCHIVEKSTTLTNFVKKVLYFLIEKNNYGKN